MNKLKVFTQATESPDIFKVYWSNNLIRPNGVVTTTVPGQIEDKMIIAELRALQYLLEERWVLGEHVTGNANTHLIVSLGAIRKLKQGRSGKGHLARYAEFLCTRFAGCEIEVDKDQRLFEVDPPEQTELLVTGPLPETIAIRRIGRVGITRHVMNRLAERMKLEQPTDPGKIWKCLQRVAGDPAVREIGRRGGLFARVAYQHQGQDEGRYFLSPKQNMVLVVTDNARGRQLVTAYPASSKYFDLAAAA